MPLPPPPFLFCCYWCQSIKVIHSLWLSLLLFLHKIQKTSLLGQMSADRIANHLKALGTVVLCLIHSSIPSGGCHLLIFSSCWPPCIHWLESVKVAVLKTQSSSDDYGSDLSQEGVVKMKFLPQLNAFPSISSCHVPCSIVPSAFELWRVSGVSGHCHHSCIKGEGPL